MGAMELREKLIEQFNVFIEDDSQLAVLSGVFDSLIMDDCESTIPDSHYLKVNERRSKYLAGETSGKSWQDVKLELKKKYGF